MLCVAIHQDPTTVHAKLDIQETINLAVVSYYVLLFAIIPCLTQVENWKSSESTYQKHKGGKLKLNTFESVGMIRNLYGTKSLLGYVYTVKAT